VRLDHLLSGKPQSNSNVHTYRLLEDVASDVLLAAEATGLGL
jgi:hypothetical protein